MTSSYWHLEQRRLGRDGAIPDTYFDAVILGGGIAGTAAAYHVRQARPTWRVALVESRRLASGATGRNAGFLLAGTADHYAVSVERYGRAIAREVFAVTVGSHRRVREFLAANPGMECGYRPCGSLTLAVSAEEAEVLRASAEMIREDGFDVRFSETDPLGRGFHGGIVNPHDGGIHPVKLVRALAETSKAEIFDDTEVFSLEADGRGIVLDTPRGKLRAERALVALNAYAPLLDGYFADKVSPVRGQVLVTAPVSKRVLEPVVYANDGFEYFRQLPDGRFLLGGGRRDFAATEIGYDDVAAPDVHGFLDAFKDRYFPELKDVPVEHRWSGIMGFTPDGLPMLGRYRDLPNVWFSLACHGHGMGFSLEVAAMAARMVTQGVVPELFDAARCAS